MIFCATPLKQLKAEILFCAEEKAIKNPF